MPARDRRPIRRDGGQPVPRAPGPPTDRRASGAGAWEPVPSEPARPGVRKAERQPPAGTGVPFATSTVLTRALLPLRIFFGVTFLYAGIDKLIDPTFLRTSGPGSIAQQITAFERTSPIAGLVHLGDSLIVQIGLLIALLEIAIGLGTLFGILFRWAAAAGAGLSLLFFLTASWATHPYYYGPDLPYMLGWLTLALAGHGHLWTVEDWLAAREATRDAAAGWPSRLGASPPRRPSGTPPMFTDQERRAFLQLGLLAFASIVVGSIGGIWGLGRKIEGGEGLTLPTPTPAGGGSAGSSPSATATLPGASPSGTAAGVSPAGASSANLIGTMSDLQSQGALMFQDPSSGDPGIVVNVSGKVLAYDAICTHQGCTVEYDPQAALLFCPCHGAEFDPAQSAAVVVGPARRPLASFPLSIQNGNIYLKA